MKSINIITAMSFAVLAIGCDHKERFTQERPTNSSVKTEEPNTIILVDLNPKKPESTFGEYLSAFEGEGSFSSDSSITETWLAVIGTYISTAHSNSSMLEVSKVFKITASLKIVVDGELIELVPKFEDPVFYDSDTDQFYTAGKVKINDQEKDIEIALKLSKDKEDLKVSILIPSVSDLPTLFLKRVAE